MRPSLSTQAWAVSLPSGVFFTPICRCAGSPPLVSSASAATAWGRQVALGITRWAWCIAHRIWSPVTVCRLRRFPTSSRRPTGNGRTQVTSRDRASVNTVRVSTARSRGASRANFRTASSATTNLDQLVRGEILEETHHVRLTFVRCHIVFTFDHPANLRHAHGALHQRPDARPHVGDAVVAGGLHAEEYRFTGEVRPDLILAGDDDGSRLDGRHEDGPPNAFCRRATRGHRAGSVV